MICVPMIVGCDGCRREATDDPEKKQEEAPQQDFTAGAPQPFPADDSRVGNAIKPGHWITASQTLQSNKVDARGHLRSVVGSRGISLRTGNASQSIGTVPNQRPVVMPKGRRRRFDYRLLPPVPSSADQKTCFLTSQFTASHQSLFFDAGSQPFPMMKSQEYFLVILTNRPQRFGKIKNGDWVRSFREKDDLIADHIHYRIVIPPVDGLLPIADTMLDWTSTAVVIWDNLPADALTPDQLTAMADWIHFGGQLIVNGSMGSSEVSKTPLQDWLPLIPTGNIELAPDAAEALLRGWQIKTDRSTEKQIALLKSRSGRVAVDGRKSADAQPLPQSGQLVLTRRIGRGHVVQPRFDLTSDWISSWQSYDSFMNSAILRRPRRAYFRADETDFVRQLYPGVNQSSANAAFNTFFRIHARDASLRDRNEAEESGENSSVNRAESDHVVIHPSTGLGGWTDTSDVITLSSDILRRESGIEIPPISLVVKSLSLYLFLLVPVNYVVFRWMGRLEYAWLAVPVIALGGALLVARAARLDIGFARSQTEMAVLEMQPGYSRGHLTRIMAIYNSLSSTYDVDFQTIDGCGLPMDLGRGSKRQNENRAAGLLFETSYQEGPMLTHIPIASNQIRLLHTEQMIDVGGGIRMTDEGLLINESSMDLQDVFVIRKDQDGEVQIAILGGCSPESSTEPRFQSKSVASVPHDLPMQTTSLIRRLVSPGTLPRGSTRLVARLDGSMDGLTLRPQVNQQLAQTIVIAHLKHSPLPVAEIDDNLLSDFRVVNALGEAP